MTQEKVYTADICDKVPQARVVPVAFNDFGDVRYFHGEIVTMRSFEDNTGIRELLASGGQGKVLLIDGQQSQARALVGGNIAALAAEQHWQGIVVNGCIRDQHEMIDLPMGIKAFGTAPMKPRLDGIAQINMPLNIEGVRILPGEYLYADPDGVIVCEKPVHS